MAQTKQTSPLDDKKPASIPDTAPDLLDVGDLHPWKIALIILHVQVELVFELSGELIIGRADSDHRAEGTYVDLTPFSAEEMGVSRQHMSLGLEGDAVVVCDLGSSNGTYLNGQALEVKKFYPVKHNDELILGAMAIQIRLLVNPLQ